MPLKSYIGRLCFLSFLNPHRDSVSIAALTHPHTPSLRYNLLCRRVRFFPYLKQFRARNYLRKYQCQHPFRTLNKAQHNRPPPTSSQPSKENIESRSISVPSRPSSFYSPTPTLRRASSFNTINILKREWKQQWVKRIDLISGPTFSHSQSISLD